MFNLGNQLWHSDSSFKATPAKYSLLSGRIVPSAGGNTEFADMPAAWDALDAGMHAENEARICDHSLIYSRCLLGITNMTENEKANFQPVPPRRVRTPPAT